MFVHFIWLHGNIHELKYVHAHIEHHINRQCMQQSENVLDILKMSWYHHNLKVRHETEKWGAHHQKSSWHHPEIFPIFYWDVKKLPFIPSTAACYFFSYIFKNIFIHFYIFCNNKIRRPVIYILNGVFTYFKFYIFYVEK